MHNEIRDSSIDGEIHIPSSVYSLIVFFSPTLKPSVLEAIRSSSCSGIVSVGAWWGISIYGSVALGS